MTNLISQPGRAAAPHQNVWTYAELETLTHTCRQPLTS